MSNHNIVQHQLPFACAAYYRDYIKRTVIYRVIMFFQVNKWIIAIETTAFFSPSGLQTNFKIEKFLPSTVMFTD